MEMSEQWPGGVIPVVRGRGIGHCVVRMAFRDFPGDKRGIELLQRSIARGRLGHAYLFTGGDLAQLESLASSLAKTLNCRHPVQAGGRAIDCCDVCAACRKIDHDNHADVFWVRPESRSRQIVINQIARRDDSPARVLLDVVNMKPTESAWKVVTIVAADRMNPAAANALLKTLEEPPAGSVLILLSTEAERLLDTILSRCLRLDFGSGDPLPPPEEVAWLAAFAAVAADEPRSVLARYRLLDTLLSRLAGLRESSEETVSSRSARERHPDAEKELREKWEEELSASIESEYRRRRAGLLSLLQSWLRDVWLLTLTDAAEPAPLLRFPELEATRRVACRLTPEQALENLGAAERLHRWLRTNVQEALALEVGLLKLHL